jgi:hypothetical protein
MPPDRLQQPQAAPTSGRKGNVSFLLGQAHGPPAASYKSYRPAIVQDPTSPLTGGQTDGQQDRRCGKVGGLLLSSLFQTDGCTSRFQRCGGLPDTSVIRVTVTTGYDALIRVLPLDRGRRYRTHHGSFEPQSPLPMTDRYSCLASPHRGITAGQPHLRDSTKGRLPLSRALCGVRQRPSLHPHISRWWSGV